MGLTGAQRQQFCKAIESAIPSSKPTSLRRVVSNVLDDDYNKLTGGESVYQDAVFRLVESVCSDGRLVELAIAILSEVPGNPELQTFIESHAVSLLVAQSEIKLGSEEMERLWVLLQPLQDFDVIAQCCCQTWPQLSQDRQSDYVCLQASNWSAVTKWFLILSWWVKTRRYNRQGRLSLVVFVERLCEVLEGSQLRGWLDEMAPQLDENWTQPPKMLSSQQQDAIRQVRGYCVVDVDLPGSDADPLIYQCKLNIEVGQDDEFKENEWKPLDNLTAEELEKCSVPALSDEIEKVCASARMETVRKQLAFWIRQAEALLLTKCAALKQTYALDQLGCYETLILEFCLPWELLIECVDIWLIEQTRRRRSSTIVIGQAYPVVVRCRDRFLDPGTLNDLNTRWQSFQSLVGDSSVMTEVDWETQVKIIDNAEVERFASKSELDLANYCRQYFGVGLIFPFCSSQPRDSEVRENLVNRFLDGGVPLIVWSRDSCLSNLDTNLKELLAQQWFQDFNMLIQDVFDKRRTEDYSLRGELGVWCDDPKRVETLYKMFNQGALGS